MYNVKKKEISQYIDIEHEFSFYLTNTIDLRKVIIDGTASSFRTRFEQIRIYLKRIYI